MKKTLRVVLALAAIVFVVIGLRWIIDPAASAATMGMPLLDGVGRSSQVGDMTAFFLTLGILMLVALISARRSWFYPPTLLLGFTAIARVLAWLVHDAALAVDMIAVEVVVAILLLLASRLLADRE